MLAFTGASGRVSNHTLFRENMNKVFVIDKIGNPLMPCHPARARQLVRDGKAKVERRVPYTIQMLVREGGDKQLMELKFDPGSKVTGIAIVAHYEKSRKVVVWAANLEHRGEEIKSALMKRAGCRRRRRNCNLRHRKARYANRTRTKGWLPPSLQSRADNIVNWAKKLRNITPIIACNIERVRFDMQVMRNPDIKGIEYQQGTLYGYEIREYLLEKWNRTCAYCGEINRPLQVEHIDAKANGGSNSVTNLAIACDICNDNKGTQSIHAFLKDNPERLKKVLAQAKAPLRHAAAVNATRNATFFAVKAILPETKGWTGGRTKFNRVSQGYEKDHWIDAACVGESGENVTIPNAMKPLVIKAMGRGNRQVKRVNKYGFPVQGKAGRSKRVFGFQTGDLVKLNQPKGKYKGEYVARLASIRASGTFDIVVNGQRIGGNFKNFTLLQRTDGYRYA